MNFHHIIAIIIIGLIAYNFIFRLIERKNIKYTIAELTPRLDSLHEQLENLPKEKIISDFEEAKRLFDESLITLKGENGKALNRCPKCNSTLTIKYTAGLGSILSCPEYPKCRYYIKFRDFLNEDFDSFFIM